MIADELANFQLLMFNDIDPEIVQAYLDFFNVHTAEALESKLIDFYGYSVH